jgi:hypothetical protein
MSPGSRINPSTTMTTANDSKHQLTWRHKLKAIKTFVKTSFGSFGCPFMMTKSERIQKFLLFSQARQNQAPFQPEGYHHICREAPLDSYTSDFARIDTDTSCFVFYVEIYVQEEWVRISRGIFAAHLVTQTIFSTFSFVWTLIPSKLAHSMHKNGGSR